MRGEKKSRLERLREAAERRKKFSKLKRDTLRKIEFIRKKPVIDPYDVYRILKEFFAGFLEKDHEFTINELKEGLRHTYVPKHTREHIDIILDRLHEIEYQDIKVSHDEMVQVLDSFEDIAHQLVRTRKKKGLLSRLRSFLLKEESDPSSIIAELPVIESNDPENIRMHMLIERCYIALEKHKLHKAKASYKALLQEYQRLPEKEREKYYELLSQTHTDIISRSKDL